VHQLRCAGRRGQEEDCDRSRVPRSIEFLAIGEKLGNSMMETISKVSRLISLCPIVRLERRNGYRRKRFMVIIALHYRLRHLCFDSITALVDNAEKIKTMENIEQSAFLCASWRGIAVEVVMRTANGCYQMRIRRHLCTCY
jgi:hypothetical protein